MMTKIVPKKPGGIVIKTPLWICATIVATATPAFADTSADDQMLIRLINGNTETFGQCARIGFTVDRPALDAAGKAATQHLTPRQVMTAVAESVADVRAQPEPHIPSDTSASARLRASIAGYDDLQKRCDQLANTPVMANYIKRDGYQAQPGAKSLLALMQYRAQTGDASAMDVIGQFYATGYEPDPDNSVAFGWFLRAADAGNAFAAGVVSDRLATGTGAPRDFIAADMWAVIAETRGQRPGRVSRLEAGMTADHIAQAHSRAGAWLSTNPPA